MHVHLRRKLTNRVTYALDTGYNNWSPSPILLAIQMSARGGEESDVAILHPSIEGKPYPNKEKEPNAQSKWRGKEMSTSIVATLPSVSFTSSAAVDLRRSRTNCRRRFSSSTVSLPRHRPFSVRGFDYSADFSILCCWFFVLRFLKSIYSLLATYIHEFEKCHMWVRF